MPQIIRSGALLLTLCCVHCTVMLYLYSVHVHISIYGFSLTVLHFTADHVQRKFLMRPNHKGKLFSTVEDQKWSGVIKNLKAHIRYRRHLIDNTQSSFQQLITN